MDTTLLIAVLAGLGGMIGWGLADLFAKKTIDDIGDIVSLVWAHIAGTVVFFLVAVYVYGIQGRPLELPTGITAWAGLLFFGVLQAIVYLLVYKGFGKGKVAVLNPVFASFSGLAALLSVLFFGEVLQINIWASLVFIFIGIMVMSLDESVLHLKKLRLANTPGFREIAGAAVLAAIWTVLWDQFVGGKDWLLYALCMYLFMSITLLLIAYVQKVNLVFKSTSAIWVFLILIGVSEAVAYIAISIGYSMTSFTSVVALLAGAFSLPTIFLARVFLKEEVTRLQTIGGLIVVGGIMLISLL